ncbi:dnaJ homolog subfamily C member 11-like isoform X2 [Hydractinia symbiolongicarpus]|uniref:dnaJ homolog subfamily C member 11-like isoform X2 n=1 Tax=Hydractinia symbiolongicarpus TaxID=13093 RepID=UPI00254FC78A|nr:dnaJ homolog subfamily C member 11-like isoform X2 [Hydractinia symbiolongicarpus]
MWLNVNEFFCLAKSLTHAPSQGRPFVLLPPPSKAHFKMADPDADGEDEYEENPDYYSILNIRKEATDEEIRSAYRRMCVTYHPDKHLDLKNKQVAENIFARIHKAYEVLSEPQTKMIYDTYGQKGLDAGWDLIERKRTPQEIREEYERLQREAEQRRIEQRTNPTGSITVQIDATDIFNSSEIDDPFYEDERSFLPSIEIRGMTINQSIEAPITKDNTAVLSGSLQNQNGNGSGSIDVSLKRVFTNKSWGEVEVGAGNGATLKLKGFHNLGKKMFASATINSALQQSKLNAGLQAMVARQLSKHSMGYLSWSGGRMSAMTSTFIRNTEHYHFMAQLQIGIPHSLALVSYTHKFGTDAKVKVSCRYGIFGFLFEYGCEHKVTSLSRLGASMSIGQASGVTLKIKIHRHTQSFNFPILLSEVVSPSAIFYGTVAPVVTYVTIKALILLPMIREQRKKDREAARLKHAKLIAERKKQAEAEILLLTHSYERAVEVEQARHGLIIREAWYGRCLSSGEKHTPDAPYLVNVTIPVQCLVKESKLILTNATKSQLHGFYDPCIDEEKHLKIIYEFRDAVHEAVFQDHEPVRIPKQSHKISFKVS